MLVIRAFFISGRQVIGSVCCGPHLEIRIIVLGEFVLNSDFRSSRIKVITPLLMTWPVKRARQLSLNVTAFLGEEANDGGSRKGRDTLSLSTKRPSKPVSLW
jgi:hypothetical protein